MEINIHITTLSGAKEEIIIPDWSFPVYPGVGDRIDSYILSVNLQDDTILNDVKESDDYIVKSRTFYHFEGDQPYLFLRVEPY